MLRFMRALCALSSTLVLCERDTAHPPITLACVQMNTRQVWDHERAIQPLLGPTPMSGDYCTTAEAPSSKSDFMNRELTPPSIQIYVEDYEKPPSPPSTTFTINTLPQSENPNDTSDHDLFSKDDRGEFHKRTTPENLKHNPESFRTRWKPPPKIEATSWYDQFHDCRTYLPRTVYLPDSKMTYITGSIRCTEYATKAVFALTHMFALAIIVYIVWSIVRVYRFLVDIWANPYKSIWLVPFVITVARKMLPLTQLYDCFRYYMTFGYDPIFQIPKGNFECDDLMFRNMGQGIERLVCVKTTTVHTGAGLLVSTQDEYIPDKDFPLPKKLIKGDRKMRRKLIAKGESALVGIDTSLELSKLPKGCVQICTKAGKFLCMGVVIGKNVITARHKSHAIEEFLIIGNNPHQKGKLIHRSKAMYVEQFGGPDWEEERMTCTMWDMMVLPLEKDDFSVIGVQALTRKHFTTKYQGKFCKIHFGAEQVPGTFGAPIYTPVAKGYLPTKIPQAHRDGLLVGRYHSDFGSSFAALIVMINGAAKIVGFNLGIPCHELADNEGSFNVAITTEAVFAVLTKMGLYVDDVTAKINKTICSLKKELDTARGVVPPEPTEESFKALIARSRVEREAELIAFDSGLPVPASKGESKDPWEDDELNSYEQFAQAWKNKRGYEHRKRQKTKNDDEEEDGREKDPRTKTERRADLDDQNDEMLAGWDYSLKGYGDWEPEPPSRYQPPPPPMSMPKPVNLPPASKLAGPPASKLSNKRKAESNEDTPTLTIDDFHKFEGEATERFDAMNNGWAAAYAGLEEMYDGEVASNVTNVVAIAQLEKTIQDLQASHAESMLLAQAAHKPTVFEGQCPSYTQPEPPVERDPALRPAQPKGYEVAPLMPTPVYRQEVEDGTFAPSGGESKGERCDFTFNQVQERYETLLNSLMEHCDIGDLQAQLDTLVQSKKDSNGESMPEVPTPEQVLQNYVLPAKEEVVIERPPPPPVPEEVDHPDFEADKAAFLAFTAVKPQRLAKAKAKAKAQAKAIAAAPNGLFTFEQIVALAPSKNVSRHTADTKVPIDKNQINYIPCKGPGCRIPLCGAYHFLNRETDPVMIQAYIDANCVPIGYRNSPNNLRCKAVFRIKGSTPDTKLKETPQQPTALPDGVPTPIAWPICRSDGTVLRHPIKPKPVPPKTNPAKGESQTVVQYNTLYTGTQLPLFNKPRVEQKGESSSTVPKAPFDIHADDEEDDEGPPPVLVLSDDEDDEAIPLPDGVLVYDLAPPYTPPIIDNPCGQMRVDPYPDGGIDPSIGKMPLGYYNRFYTCEESVPPTSLQKVVSLLPSSPYRIRGPKIVDAAPSTSVVEPNDHSTYPFSDEFVARHKDIKNLVATRAQIEKAERFMGVIPRPAHKKTIEQAVNMYTAANLHELNCKILEWTTMFMEGKVEIALEQIQRTFDIHNRSGCAYHPKVLLALPAYAILREYMQNTIPEGGLKLDLSKIIPDVDGHPFFIRGGSFERKLFGKKDKKPQATDEEFVAELTRVAREAFPKGKGKYEYPDMNKDVLEESMRANAKLTHAREPVLDEEQQKDFDMSYQRALWKMRAGELPGHHDFLNPVPVEWPITEIPTLISQGAEGFKKLFDAMESKSSGISARHRLLKKREYAAMHTDELLRLASLRIILIHAWGPRIEHFNPIRMVEEGLVDIKELVLKAEPTSPQKLRDGRCRSIWICSLLDYVVQGMFHKSDNDHHIFQFQKGTLTCSAAGLGHDDTGISNLCRALRRENLSNFHTSCDATAWDYSVTRRLINCDALRRASNVSGLQTKDFLLAYSAILSSHIVANSQDVWICCKNGVMPSGQVSTTAQNTFTRCVTAAYGGCRFWIVAGDDLVGDIYFNHFKLLHLGIRSRDLVKGKRGLVTFTSHLIDVRSETAQFLNGEKMLWNLIHNCAYDNEEELALYTQKAGSCMHILRNTPELYGQLAPIFSKYLPGWVDCVVHSSEAWEHM